MMRLPENLLRQVDYSTIPNTYQVWNVNHLMVTDNI